MKKKQAFSKLLSAAMLSAVATGCDDDIGTSPSAGSTADTGTDSSSGESSAPTPADNAAAQAAPYDGHYNIMFITTDQEHYFESPPAGTNWKARELLASVGATFEKHYVCSNMSTSSRSTIYTGQHITGTEMVDNSDMPW